jgi:MarR family transcriptional regulator, transcriptional regulator for hemolysin
MEKLNAQFFYNLEKAVKSYRQYFQSQLKKNGFDITLDQWLILRIVGEHPDISQNDIAEMAFKDKASITRIIELLVQNGYLTRAIHSTNRRMFELTLTEKGTDTLEKLKDLVVIFRQNALEGIGLEVLRDTQTVMTTIVKNCKNNQNEQN